MGESDGEQGERFSVFYGLLVGIGTALVWGQVSARLYPTYNSIAADVSAGITVAAVLTPPLIRIVMRSRSWWLDIMFTIASIALATASQVNAHRPSLMDVDRAKGSVWCSLTAAALISTAFTVKWLMPKLTGPSKVLSSSIAMVFWAYVIVLIGDYAVTKNVSVDLSRDKLAFISMLGVLGPGSLIPARRS